MNFQNTFRHFAATLRRDKGLYYAYQANIAMAYKDEAWRQGSRDSRIKLHEIANQAAVNFLDLLIKPMRPQRADSAGLPTTGGMAKAEVPPTVHS